MLSPAPPVSVIISLHNAAAFVDDAVRSLLAQTHGNVQIIVVDNASTDHGAGCVERISDPRVELHHLPAGDLYPTAWNHGFAHARGEWVVFSHADDRHHPEFLQKLLAAVQPGNLDLACCWLRAINGRGQHDEKQGRPYENAQNLTSFDFADWQRMRWSCPFISPSILMRRTFAEKLMPFEPGLITANYLWQLRAAAHNWRGVLVAEPLVDLRLHPQSLSATVHPDTYLIHWVYAHLAGYRPMAATRMVDHTREMEGCHAVLAGLIAASTISHTLAGVRLLQASLKADGMKTAWSGFGEYRDEILGAPPEALSVTEDFSILLGDYFERLGSSAQADQHGADLGGLQTENRESNAARAKRLRSELDREKSRSQRLRDELDRLKRRHSDLLRDCEPRSMLARFWDWLRNSNLR